jgi:colanic acid/amylovoran biosynthesis glycosyltransferase
VKLAVFTSRYPAQVGTFFERDMRALLEAGVDIDVFSIAPLDESLWKHSLALLGPEHLSRDRVHHLRLGATGPGLAWLGDRTARHDARAILASARQYGAVPFAKTAYVLPKAWTWARDYRNAGYDHVLAYWGNYAGTCAYVFHRLATPDVPFSIWLHAGTDLYFRRVFMREKLLYADAILTCCEFNVQYVAREFGDIAAQLTPKIHVSHHGLDLSTFVYQPEGRPAGHVLAVGRFAKDKGYNYLLRAAAVARARGVDFQIEFIGQGPEERNLVALAAELGVSDRVRFRGWQPFPEVRRAMSEATVLVHPSTGLGDGLPNVVREAMAVGTPVIASDVAGIPDALQDGCGVLVPARNVEALAAAITDLLADPARRVEIARRARQRVEQHYDLWQNGRRLAEILRATRRQDHSLARERVPMTAAASGTTKPSYDLVALDLMLGAAHPAACPDPDHLDWSELRQAAERGGALVRVADALHRPGEPLPPTFSAKVAPACRRAQQTVELVAHLSDTCRQLGEPHAFLRTAECYPDPPRIIELLVGETSSRVDRDITRDLVATRAHGALHHRVAGVTTYRLAHGIRLAIRHGRLGRAGEHARFARLLLARSRPGVMGTAAPMVPSPTDHVLLLAMQQIYTRPGFRLSELHTAIDALRPPLVDWDDIFANALSTATLSVVGAYLRYVDGVYQAIRGDRLVSDVVLERFATAGPSLPAARLYWQHLRATLESGRWHSAARLSLMPLIAALTGGVRPTQRRKPA